MTRPAPAGLQRAFDEARFGPARTLDLHTSLPTRTEAARRTELWLRERQVARAGEVLVITGRGKGSPGGVSVVREAIRKLLTTLKRKGVVAAVMEHTPGSFVVTLASMHALLEAGPRSRGRAEPAAPSDPAVLSALDVATREALRDLAERALEALGAPREERFIQDEMLRQFGVLSGALAVEARAMDRDARLRTLIAAAREALDEAQS